MKTRYFYTLKVIELDYAKDYHAHIEYEATHEHGLRCEISLADNEDDSELVIGTITTGGSMEDCEVYAFNMLSDEDYCSSVWKEHIKRRNKRKCAAY